MIFVDAHVHIYDCFDLESFLNSALINFRTAAERIGPEQAFAAVLLLAEIARNNWFERLAEYADNGQLIESRNAGNWTFNRTNENCSLLAQHDGGQKIFVIAGRQIMTAEDLEVLALITDNLFEDGRPFKEVIQIVKDVGAIPVVPWGFGKWTGIRGKIVKNTLRAARESELFLGDNGGRPALWPRPAHFKEAEKKRVRILQGSDPLPFVSESNRVARYGLIIQSSLSLDHPATHLKKLLLDPEVTFEPYGHLETPYRFIRNQFALRMKRYLDNLKK